MSPSPESERPYPQSPVYGYFFELVNMTSAERDRILAVGTLCEKIIGESASDELLRQLVYEPGSSEPASIERMVTYPIIVFGELMEQALPAADTVVEYSRTLQKVLWLCRGSHDESCAISGRCRNGALPDGTPSFCPVTECVDFLASGMREVDTNDLAYQIDGWQTYKSVSIRAKALMRASQKLSSHYEPLFDAYRWSIQAGRLDIETDLPELD